MPTGSTLSELSNDALTTFAEDIDGDLILPDDDNYNDARDTWNGLIDTRPAIIARVQGADDVSAALQFADEHNLEFSIRGNAHHQAGSALIEDGLVIDLADLTKVEIDAENKTVVAGPGLSAGEALEQTLEQGFGFPTGSAEKVGLSGSTLGGGIGWMRRENGLGVDALREVELVTADGEILTASADENEDLFWALCGGGGNFGVVTEFTFELSEMNPIVPAVGIFYKAEDADKVLEEYRRLTADAPDGFTSMILYGEVPHLDDIPEELQGTPAIAIMGCYLGDGDSDAVLNPFRNIAEPVLDMSDDLPYMVLHELGADIFPDGELYCHRSAFVDELTDDVLEYIREGKEAAPSDRNAIGVWHLGGAVGEDDAETAIPWDDHEYLVTVEGHWLDDAETPENLEWAQEQERRLRDLGGEYAYAGFTGVEEQEWEDWASQVYGENYDRLAEVKAEYDPENRFRQNVNIEPRD